MNKQIICRLLYIIDNNFMRYSYLITIQHVNHLTFYLTNNGKYD
jgi:hypothetical protein